MGAYRRVLSKGVRWFFSGQHLWVKYHSKAIYHTKGECLKAERLRIDELERKQRFPNEMTLKALMEARLDYIHANKSKDYYKETKRYFKLALSVLGDVGTDKIKKSDISMMLSAEAKRLKKAGKSNQKANSMLKSLKALFNYGIKVFELDIKNPCNLDFFPVDINLKHIPTEEEIESVRKMLDADELFLFDFVYETGARINEAVRLRWSDVRETAVVLRTRKAKNSNLTPRIIPRPEVLNGLTGEGKVFKKWNAYPRFLEGKADWNWHNLRHRRASMWATSGMSVFEVMTRLGHQNMQTTMKYLQLLGFSHSLAEGSSQKI